MIAIGAQPRITLEFLSRAPLHDKATTLVEFCPLNLGRDFPKQPANDGGAGQAEDCLRRIIEGGETPVTIKREETLTHPLKEGFDKGFLL
jgi:hypothetical protein